MKKARDLLKINVSRLREKLRLNQPELADEAGLSSQMIQKIEQGRTSPSLETLDKLVKGLNANHAQLFQDAAISGSADDTIGQMKVIDLSTIIANEVVAHIKSDQTISLRSPQAPYGTIPPALLEAWPSAPDEIKAVCLYLLTGRPDHLSALSAEMWKRLKKQFDFVGVKPERKARS